MNDRGPTAASEGGRLAALARAVRESTMKRLRSVPVGSENWHPVSGALSPAEVAQHLLDADAWLLRKLVEPGLAPMVARTGIRTVAHRQEYERLLGALEETGRRREEALAAMDAATLAVSLPDDRSGGPVSVWWLVVRGNLDHETHHRGQIAVYLRLLGAVGEG